MRDTTTKWSDSVATHRELGHTDTVMRPGFVLELYGDSDLNAYGEIIFNRLWELFPPDRDFYCINQTGHEFKQLSHRALSRLRKTLSRLDTKPQFYMMKDAPDFHVEQFSAELDLGGDSNRVILGLPLDLQAKHGSDYLADLFYGFVAEFPFSIGTAGYSFHQVCARECEMVGMPMNLHVARRFWGIGIRHRYQEKFLSRSLKSAHWLTFVDRSLLAELGGSDSLSNLEPEVDVTPVRGGVLLRAGSDPPIGDVNAQAPDIEPMRKVNAFIKPIRINRWITHNLFRGDPEDAHAWLRRLDP